MSGTRIRAKKPEMEPADIRDISGAKIKIDTLRQLSSGMWPVSRVWVREAGVGHTHSQGPRLQGRVEPTRKRKPNQDLSWPLNSDCGPNTKRRERSPTSVSVYKARATSQIREPCCQGPRGWAGTHRTGQSTATCWLWGRGKGSFLQPRVFFSFYQRNMEVAPSNIQGPLGYVGPTTRVFIRISNSAFALSSPSLGKNMWKEKRNSAKHGGKGCWEREVRRVLGSSRSSLNLGQEGRNLCSPAGPGNPSGSAVNQADHCVAFDTHWGETVWLTELICCRHSTA